MTDNLSAYIMENNKIYPLIGNVDVGPYHLEVKFSSETDEQNTRRAVKTINERLKDLGKGNNDSINLCAVILLINLMMENIDLKTKLEDSMKRISAILDSDSDE